MGSAWLTWLALPRPAVARAAALPPTAGQARRVSLAAPHGPPFLAALLRPDSYTHAADDLQLYETHISWVVLAGSYAYKLKKPVDFGFLDYSTVERREAACADEVRLNRRLCPDVYLGVAHLCARDGAFFVGGPGQPVEPLVWMRRLPESGMLPRLLATDAADAALMRRIARKLARFHAAAATGPGVDEHGSLATVRANWEENFAQTRPVVGRVLSAAAFEGIERFVRRFLDERAEMFARRVAAGRVRDGHGDLHAASVCVEGRRVQLFDCIEFSARYRCADVAAEVAFLAMDLDHYGRADLAEAFVGAHVQASGDAELRALLPFYACYRAYVRGKVLGLRLGEGDLSPEEAEAVRAEAAAYFDLAWAYAGGLGGPTLVVTMGLPASGKTTLAHALARRLGLVHLSSDVIRKELAGLRPTDRQDVPFGAGIYSAAATQHTYAALRRRAARWLRAGRSVVLDATFGQRAERAGLRRLAARAGARLVVLHCQADDATLVARLVARPADPHTASDARLALWPALRAAFTPPDELAETIAMDAAAPPQQLVERALSSLLPGRVGVG
ncbi:MAG: AAA family ATPase [Chloroflexi bacterium]|nr:AAA family ATPase [Chloroflexota bacterium]